MRLKRLCAGIAAAFPLLAVLLPSKGSAAEYKWWNRMVGATAANQVALGDGAGIRVGVIDGLAVGVDPLAAGPTPTLTFVHPEFVPRIDADHVFGYPPDSWSNYNGIGDRHGTHVAGIVGAARDGIGMAGIAPGVSLTSVGVFSKNGPFIGTTTDALQRAAASGATIANMSYTFSNGRLFDADDLQGILAHRNDLFLTKSAGNDGVALKSQVTAAPLDNLIIVGALTKRKTLASFSNRPGNGCFKRTAARGCVNASALDKFKYRFLVAPGVGILSTKAGGGYLKLSGTSMAAPMVAGAAALLQSHWPGLTPQTTAQILLSTAQDLGRRGVDPVYGRGLLRIDRAMQAQGETAIATGQTVSGPRATESAALLPAGAGNNAALQSALEGMVVFDRFGRDFKLSDPGGLVSTASSAYSLKRHFQNRFEMTGRGALVSIEASNGLSFTGVVLDWPGDDNTEIALMQREALQSAAAAYAGYMQGEHNPWEIDGAIKSFSFNFGQRTGLARDIGFGTETGLFLFDAEAASQPLMNLGEQSFHAYGRYALNRSFGVAVGFAESAAQTGSFQLDGTGSAYLMQLDYRPLAWLGLQATQSFLSENDTVLGGVSTGALAFGSGASTVATGGAVSIEVLPRLSVRLHYTESVTETSAAPGSLFRAIDPLESRAYGASLIRTGLFGANDQIGISVSRPLQVHAGEAVLDTPTGQTIDGDVIYKRSVVPMAPDAAQTDFDLGYQASLSPQLSLGLNAFYQDEVNNEPGEWNAGVVGRVRLVLQPE
ncbi:MAG TPA: S8 family serine peptidase [Methyloceanibacter sp.]|nr:S8 family serine peptidase [Methyloceanibacter sp.]